MCIRDSGNALPFALVSWGQVKVDASLAAIFMAVMPLATILLAHIMTGDEKYNKYKLAGVTLGFSGIVILMGIDSLSSLGDESLRQFAILCAAVCYAVNAIITRKLTSIPRYSMVAALTIAASILLVPASVFIDHPWNLSVSTTAVLSILALAAVSTVLATILLLMIIDRCGATFMSQINFMVPLFGVFFGTLLLGERLSANAYIALIVILIALAMSRYGQNKKPNN